MPARGGQVVGGEHPLQLDSARRDLHLLGPVGGEGMPQKLSGAAQAIAALLPGDEQRSGILVGLCGRTNI